MSLLVALHDVAPPHLPVVARLRERLAGWGVGRVTLLVVPDYHGAHPLERSPATLAWLRERAAAGDEIALHGERHLQRRPARRTRDRWRAAVVTAGEGECLGLEAPEIDHMLDQGKRRLEDAAGAAVHGFVAPAWLEPPGFARHLAAAGFRWHETTLWVERRAPAALVWQRRRGPVIGFATRSPLRLAAALASAALLAPVVGLAARHGALARVALHPADAGSPAVLRAAERVLRGFAPGLSAATYTDALSPHGERGEARLSLRLT